MKDTYSRLDLQTLKETNRKQSIRDIVRTPFMEAVRAASAGKSQFLWESSQYAKFKNHIDFTNEELILALQEKFPDATISYQETWIETRPGFKEKKDGILIDWS